LYNLDSTANISQPPVPLGILNGVTPKAIKTALLDEQTDEVRFDGDVFAFSLATQFAAKAYKYADELREEGKKVIMGGIHVTIRPEEAMQHADAVVTGEAETIWPMVCEDLLTGKLKERYDGAPTLPSEMVPIDYRFFAGRPYRTQAPIFATRGCNHRCAFCVSSAFMGPFRNKPVGVLEKEIDQLAELHPGAHLQFTDDNLLADRGHAAKVLDLLRRKKRRFVTMITVDQLCDEALMQEMASAGCMAVAVGVESLDDDNCTSVGKSHNVGQPFAAGVRRARELGIQVAALLMVGLPHDTPAGLGRTRYFLAEVGCSLYDLRILRIYPGSRLYDRKLADGSVTEGWWLGEEPVASNNFLPGHLRVHFRHPHFSAMELQQWALKLTIELNRISAGVFGQVMHTGQIGKAKKLAAVIMAGRRRYTKQARKLLASVEEAMMAEASAEGSGRHPQDSEIAEALEGS
jgi:radical SAM superfamily enzyme YgiQ (UPF0313 family)